MAKGKNIHARHNERKRRAKERVWYGWVMGDSDKWWQQWDVSTKRKYAKKYTAKRNRSVSRYMSDIIDIEAPLDKPSTYRKRHEYNWIIW